MKILLLHLSDLHIKSETDEILNQADQITAAIKNRLDEVGFLIIIVSGDITNSGKVVEYTFAGQFFSNLEQAIKIAKPETHLEYVIVPGNHDCDYSLSSGMREAVIKTMAGNPELLNDFSIVQDCAKIQKPYFDWAASIPPNGYKNDNEKIYNERTYNISEKIQIKFLLFNTAWMTCPGENHGNILFPNQLVQRQGKHSESDLIISVLHHPYNWIQAEESRDFKELIEQNSNIIMTGHEHSSLYYEKRFSHGETRQYFEGGKLQGEGKRSFNSILIDVENRKLRFTEHSWQESLFIPDETEWVDMPRSKSLGQNRFIPLKEFTSLRWSPSVGQVRGLIKRESCHSHGVWYH